MQNERKSAKWRIETEGMEIATGFERGKLRKIAKRKIN